MNLRVLIIILSIVVSSVAEAVELTGDITTERPRGTIQHLSQDSIIGVFSFVDYLTLGKFRRVCKRWKTLIDDKLPIKQKYTLKLIAQFSKSFSKFAETFLIQLSKDLAGKTVLDDIIEELQEDLEVSKEQAYQALLNTKLMQSCPSMEVNIEVNDRFTTKSELVFPYISASLFDKIRKKLINQPKKINIRSKKLKFIRKEQDVPYIFGIRNLSKKLPNELQDKLKELDLSRLNLKIISKQIHKLPKLQQLNLSDNQLTYIPSEIAQLTNLNTLDLRNNQLNGVPSEIKKALPNCEIIY